MINIEFDELDIESVNLAIEKLHKHRLRLCRTDIKAKLSNTRYEKRLASLQKEIACIEQIYLSNIDDLFTGSNEFSYYVYVHCNPRAGLNIKKDARHFFCATSLKLQSQPFYVGKGIGLRCEDLNRNEGHRKVRQFLQKIDTDIVIVKLHEGLTERQAFALESKLIDILGLKSISDYGLLTNLDEGQSANERRRLYPKGSNWYLNKIKLQPYSVPKG